MAIVQVPTPQTGGMTLLSTTTLSGATATISGISGDYNSLFIIGYGVTNATADGTLRIAPNGSTNISNTGGVLQGSVVNRNSSYIFCLGDPSNLYDRTSANNVFSCQIDNYKSTTHWKTFLLSGGITDSVNSVMGGPIKTTSAITSLVFSNSGGNLSTGTVLLYGVK